MRLIFAAISSCIVAAHASVFINEFHYDNDGADTGEFVEIAGPAGTSLSGYSIVLYNGNGGARYATYTLSGTLADQTSGYGFAVVSTPSMQNGSPDGLALVKDGVLVEFLSYEGTLTAVDGPAAGITSTDVGVSESSSTQIGHSLQLANDVDGSLKWTGPIAATPGAVNTGQTFNGAPPPDPVDPCANVTSISTVQGAGTTSPVAGSRVRVVGVVTAVLSGLQGFHIQTPDDRVDSFDATSEGLFIFTGTSGISVGVGDLVSICGDVSEYFGNTQLAPAAGPEIISTGNPQPAPRDLSGVPNEELERYEGMVVTFMSTMVVTEFFNLDRCAV